MTVEEGLRKYVEDRLTARIADLVRSGAPDDVRLPVLELLSKAKTEFAGSIKGDRRLAEKILADTLCEIKVGRNPKNVVYIHGKKMGRFQFVLYSKTGWRFEEEFSRELYPH